jgi:hypothetical protein
VHVTVRASRLPCVVNDSGVRVHFSVRFAADSLYHMTGVYQMEFDHGQLRAPGSQPLWPRTHAISHELLLSPPNQTCVKWLRSLEEHRSAKPLGLQANGVCCGTGACRLESDHGEVRPPCSQPLERCTGSRGWCHAHLPCGHLNKFVVDAKCPGWHF